MTNTQSRRSFLQAVSGLAASGAMPPRGLQLAVQLASLGALASQTSQAANLGGGYKALVCLYLHGGSDHHNWVVPIDPSGYAEYAKARGDLAWPLQRLLPIATSGQASGRAFGMPTELAPLKRWYDSGHAAILANIGPLLRPLTRTEAIAGVGLPPKLYSHNDQASTWQSLSPEGASSGWGGRMGDILMSANANPVFTAISTTGNAVFLTGSQVSQYQIGVEGPVTSQGLGSGSLFGSSSAAPALRRAYESTSTDQVLNEYKRVVRRNLGASAALQSAIAGTNVPQLPATPVLAPGGGGTTLDKIDLARQLRMVLQLAAANVALGMKRQVFMVSMGGFDTHANQMRDQPAHMAQVATSIDYFQSALAALGMHQNVSLFTASDFGRTLVSNGDGSDHGWGSHHFVVGGAVRGGNIHGRFPETALGTANDLGSGRLLPTMAVTELAASLGGWLGLSVPEQQLTLPSLKNFATSLPLFAFT